MSNPGSTVRTLRLTGKAHTALNAADRVTPADLFTDTQLEAIRKAGYAVWFARAERLLGVAR